MKKTVALFLKDLENTAKLLSAFVMKLDKGIDLIPR